MYLISFRLENLKCFEDITITFTANRDNHSPSRQRNWNVILGENGDGKTTLLQAIAACLMDESTIERIVNYDGWPRLGEGYGRLTLNLKREEEDLIFQKQTPISNDSYSVQYIIIPPHGFVQEDKRVFLTIGSSRNQPKNYQLKTGPHLEKTDWIDPTDGKDVLLDIQDDNSSQFEQESVAQFRSLKRTYIFTQESHKGWFSCGYGPFRRVYGSTTHGVNVDNVLQERFMTLFIEEVALHKCEDWLKDLERLALKRGEYSVEHRVYEEVKQSVIKILGLQNLLLEDKLYFIQNGNKFLLSQLSDGYRSLFVLVVDILRWLERHRSDMDMPLNQLSGVVLIDEVEAHLHPKWQRQIGFELTEIFPNIQFIVTTHSPYVAMAAGPDGLTILQRQEKAVVANQNVPYIRDWTVDRVINDLFGESKYSLETEADLEQYNDLRYKKQSESLSDREQHQLRHLEESLNQRLVNDRNAPENQSRQTDLAYLKQLIQQQSSHG